MLKSVVVFLHRNMKLINLGSPALADKSRDAYASVLPFCKGALKIREWKMHYYLPYSCKNFLYIMQVAWITHSPVRRKDLGDSSNNSRFVSNFVAMATGVIRGYI